MHLKSCGPEDLGEDDPALLEEIARPSLSLEEKFDALSNELKIE